MHLLTQIRRKFITSLPVKFIIRKSKNIIPPACIFIFTLIPYLPITEFMPQLYELIRDVIPGKENNQPIIDFLEDFTKNERSGLLSFGFLLALYFSSNAMIGIMGSFNKMN